VDDELIHGRIGELLEEDCGNASTGRFSKIGRVMNA
jgi:hypothetical protein